MRVSAKAEYACIAMFELAVTYRDPQPARLRSIAEAHGIPPRFLVQILLQLKTAGLVTSTRGSAGGYQLARPAEKISMADVLAAIERAPPPRPIPVASPQSAAVQAIRSVWRDIQAEEQRILAELTLAELVRRTQQSGALSYQI